MKGLMAIFRRELRLAMRQSTDSAMVVAFFIIAVVLFAFGVGPEPNMLAKIGPGVIWVAALLAAMLSMDRLFQSDHDDGTLELLVLAPVALELTVCVKILVHWLTTGLPLIIAAPLLFVMMNVPTEIWPVMLYTLLLGTPVLSLIGSVGAALVLGARRGGVLLSLLVLPLLIPVLIFAVGAGDAVLFGQGAKANLLLLGGMFLASLALAPWATAQALREAVA
ncbi:MAG: heme exporter protein CcmB [Rhodospirillales bacterium]|jgi:heme exporter protein B|nr:heme exporter protein CcmB [Rhodospirillales bacterium]